MARLKHEIWMDVEGLPGCLLAGPRGSDARKLMLSEGSRLVHVFEADSHIQAMEYYNAYLGREPYWSSYPEIDGQPYPEEWLVIQQQWESQLP